MEVRPDVLVQAERNRANADGGAAPAPNRQPQIQALRAIAVVAVIVYHFWPQRLPGGYVGVDVFFVISGYLMTMSVLHIRGGAHERLGATMREFYARRIARIMPAAVLTLLACAIGVITIMAVSVWRDYLHQIVASGFFGENWYLASNSTDYLGSSSGSPVQHFWSLSVEEQFYVVWPVLVFFAASRATSRLTDRGKVLRLLAVFVPLTALSFWFSVHATVTEPSRAYFDTRTRFWELSLGGIVFVVDRHLRLGRHTRAFAGWFGLTLIAYAVLSFTGATSFPGWHAAIPVLGAAGVVLASPVAAPWGPTAVLSHRLPQWIGDISYSLYLVHWPLLVLVTADTSTGTGLDTARKLALLPVLVVISALLKRYVEDRFRRSSPRRRQRRKHGASRGRVVPVRWTIAAVLAVEAALVVISTVGVRHVDTKITTAQHAVASFTTSSSTQEQCYQAISALQPSTACPHATADVFSVVPNPLVASQDWPFGSCQAGRLDETDKECRLVSGNGPLMVVAGDSHMTQWLPALVPLAKKHHFSLVTLLKSGCPLTDTGTWGGTCMRWNAKVLNDLRALKPAYVLTSVASPLSDKDVPGFRDQLIKRWSDVTAMGAKLIAFRDIPQPDSSSVGPVPACLTKTQSFDACTFSEQDGLHRDIVSGAAARVPGTAVVDMADWFCPNQTCRPEFDGILVWIDGGHMSSYFARGLTTALDRKLTPALAR